MAKRPAKKSAKKVARPTAKPKAKPVKKPAPAVKAKAAKAVAKPTPKPAPKPTGRSTPPPSQPLMRMAPPPPPVAVVKKPSAEAVAVFERGMQALGKRDFAGAATILDGLLAEFPTEGSLADRARVYLDAAHRELSRQRAGRTSIEERLTAATLALNNHNDAEALRLAVDVLTEDSSQDLAEYLLAVIGARGDNATTAVAHLRNAIALNPECRLQARQDDEFTHLMGHEEFRTLIDTIPANSAARRPLRKPGR